MDEKVFREILKPIYDSVENFAPTNRKLINFVNEKARGEGIKRSLYKVKFIEKSERSAKQLTGVTMVNFKKHIRELNFSDDEISALENEASKILDGAKNQIEKVYGEVRRYIVTSELRGDCVKTNFKKIPGLSSAQNEVISKEIFSLALEEINKSDKNSIDDIEAEFRKINHIATTLFEIVEREPSKKADSKPKKEQKKSFSLLDRFF